MLLCLLAMLVSVSAWAGKPVEIKLTPDDVFRLRETDHWTVTVEDEKPLRFADVRMREKRGYPFALTLSFRADTPDIGQYDAPEKMERAVLNSTQKYMPYIIEKTIALQKVPVTSTYGVFTVITDAEVAQKQKTEPREFKYMTLGMVRLSKNSALVFNLVTPDIDSSEYRKILQYIYGFVKPGAKS